MKGNRSISLPANFFFLPVLFAVIFIPGLSFAESGWSNRSTESATIINGYLSAKYVYRSARGLDAPVTDKDLFGELRVDMAAPESNKYEFHFFGTARDDFSGNRNRSTFNPLEDIGDTYRSSLHGYLYEAHLDVNNLFPSLNQVRIGRQTGTRDEPVFFDGAATDISVATGMNLTLYGGAAVHLYEIDNHWGDDSLAGAGLDYSPGLRTKVSVDYLSVRDKRVYPFALDLQDRMASLKLWQSIGSFMKGSVRYRYLNGESRDVSVRAVTAFRESDAELNINYFRQFSTQNELSNELSLYYDVLGRSSPYQSYDIKARKLFGKHYAADAGYFKREILQEAEKSAFDRDFSRLFLLFELIDLPKDGLSFTLIGERWETLGRNYASAGADIGYASKRIKNATVNAGTYYSLYKYDYYVEQGLREKVRTYYVSGRYPLGKRMSVNGSCEHEYSIENYRTFKLGMRYDF